ncbi:uracil-DNA glycosylase [Candidatus Moduliflexus flocculans]|uniref:Uracil-DNA glycosylase n=1 Tax=Candidatus Moduliflexus flocculans TaxID=1499966 RepID=A0A081BN58_9BACT|nr:uracil-DNA glycosylase [Candidatus Moduliflexus flocculans]
MPTCKITVIKRTAYHDLAEEYMRDASKFGVCNLFREGQEFIVRDPFRLPEGFCEWAWGDIRHHILMVSGGADMAWMKQRNTLIAGCTDWFRPVLFKIERIDDDTAKTPRKQAKSNKQPTSETAQSVSPSNFALPTSWQTHLRGEMAQPYFQELMAFVQQEYATRAVYPPADLLFSAFQAVPFEQVKVVILGQDPYHGKGQANGLAFSVSDGVSVPPSLKNIFQEIAQDLGQPIPTSGNLMRWAEQGVLLLNAILTVVEKTPRSHQNKGWERFTDAVIRILSEQREHLVFLLWGAYAQKKGDLIDRQRGHLILEAAHPSPYSAANGFFGCRHFSQTNVFLETHGLTPIRW